jgi:dephospho-CoA kinase
VIVAGLTGSIAMGKSTVAAMFAALGVPVFDADAAVRDFYSSDGAKTVEEEFPGVLIDGRISRDLLSRFVLGDALALKRLEGLVHPAVADKRSRFVARAAAEGQRLAVVDVPLLFEAKGESSVDLVVVVSASKAMQRDRALARAGMSEAKLDAILSRQLTDSEKRLRAHYVIDTSGSFERTRAQVGQFLRAAVGLERREDPHA